MLNSGSTLTYSTPFLEAREVTLTGEAWFEVEPNTKLPFEVSSGEMKLTVIGTTFNVSAYPEDNYVEVVLEKGSLLVNCGFYDEGIVMHPSERLVYKDGVVSRSIEETEKYSSWTKGKLVFRSDSMVEVARRIERWYNVKLELMDSELERYSFRATFEDDPLEEVLKYLSMTSPIRYEIIPGMVDENSTFTKKTVKVFLQ
jgi:ferric-dicitrate binding protein FerR (iron transport regulator)